MTFLSEAEADGVDVEYHSYDLPAPDTARQAGGTLTAGKVRLRHYQRNGF